MVLFRFKSFFLVCLLLVSFLVVVLPVGAVDWLSGWEYRKEIVFDFVVSEGTQVTFNVTYSELNGHCQSDFADLRFYYVNGSQALAFNQTVVSGDFVEVWLRSDGSDSLYVYYGNSDVGSDWASVDEVFEDVIGDVVLALPMDEGSGSVVYDYSGNDFDGTVSYGEFVDGKFGSALFFNSTLHSNVLVSGLSSTFGNYSFVFWVNSSVIGSPSNPKYLFDSQSGRFVVAWAEYTYGTKLGYYDGVSWCNFTSSPNDGSWHNLVFVFNGSLGSLFVDGVQSGGVNTYSSKNLGSVVRLGTSFLNNFGWFDGVLDDVLIFEGVLDGVECGNVYDFYADSAIIEGSVVCRVWVPVMPSVSFGGEVVSNQVLQENLDFVYLLAFLGVVCALGALCWVLMR